MARYNGAKSQYPVTRVLALCGYSLPQAAGAMGVTYSHLKNVSYGLTPPSPELAKAFRTLTGKSIRPLLEPGMRKRAFQPHKRTRPAH